MRRVIAISATAFLLTGCGSLSIPGLDSSRSAAPVMLQLESSPPGAEARTSVGPVCTTPCAVAVPADASFTVTYTLPRYKPQTIAVQLVQKPGRPDAQDPDILGPSVVELDPNPAFVQLEPAGPVRRSGRPIAGPPKKKNAAAPTATPKAAPKATPKAARAPARAPAAAPAAAQPGQDASPFPAPQPAPPASSGSSPFPDPRR